MGSVVALTKKLKFAVEGLQQGAKSVGRLRDFKSRIERAQLPPGKNEEVQSIAYQAKRGMRDGLEADLNTAQALAAIFDMVREVNTLADLGELREGDKPPLLEALQQFDEIFAVLKDDHTDKVAPVV